jgi:hypothetical protein
MTIRIRALLLLALSLAACAAAAASARLLAGCVDVRGMEVAWQSWQNRLHDVRKARRTLAELERKHGARPFERWPAENRDRHFFATHALEELGEEP